MNVWTGISASDETPWLTINNIRACRWAGLLSRCKPAQVSLLLEDRAESSLYVVELQLGPTEDLHVIRLVERWAAGTARRSAAVLVAEQIELRYLNFVSVICRAVPVVAIEMREVDVLLRFTPLRLR